MSAGDALIEIAELATGKKLGWVPGECMHMETCFKLVVTHQQHVKGWAEFSSFTVTQSDVLL